MLARGLYNTVDAFRSGDEDDRVLAKHEVSAPTRMQSKREPRVTDGSTQVVEDASQQRPFQG
jgi:hypothetical protein